MSLSFIYQKNMILGTLKVDLDLFPTTESS